MHADLDDLLTALYVLVDDLLPARRGAGRRPRITDAELITLAVAQILLQCHSERRFLRLAGKQLGHCSPTSPSSRATTSGCGRWRVRSAWLSSISSGSPRRSASGFGCWIRASGLSVIDEREITRRYEIPGRRYADFAILRGDPSDGLPGLRGVGSVTAAAIVRRYGDLAGVLRERPLRDTDRDYLVKAMRVVPPVADLPIALPAGRRDAYPARQTARSLVAQYGLQESSDRLLAAMVSVATGNDKDSV